MEKWGSMENSSQSAFFVRREERTNRSRRRTPHGQ